MPCAAGNRSPGNQTPIITGRVQGVGFRYYMEYKARQFHVNGWVRNRHDGSVEAMIQGTPEHVESMIARAHHGPRHRSPQW